MFAYLKPAVIMLLLMTLLTGVAYPVLVTVLAQVLFDHQANGSLISNQRGQLFGSELIGQRFSQPQYFWSRPSATQPYEYNAEASSGSNLGPTNPALLTAAQVRMRSLRLADANNQAPVPVDLVTSSASGLDPHISIAAAEYQITRVAKARKIDAAKLRQLLGENIEDRQWLLFGEPRVNVLKLNLALDQTPL